LLIDIIIPAYNSHKTIVDTLRSIAVQTMAKQLRVTIVNDGGEGYGDIMSSFPEIEISEIKTENGGPALARQVGIERTSLPFIVFIDSDDVFSSVFSISEVYSEIVKSEDVVCVNSRFFTETENGSIEPFRGYESVWLFGNIYRRSFISSNKIRFPKFNSNEDLIFNLEVSIKSMQQGKRIVYTDKHTYLWKFNPRSITRRDNAEYGYFESPYHVIMGKAQLFRRFPRDEVAKMIFESVWDFYYFWEESVLNRMKRPDYHNKLMASIRDFYAEYSDVLSAVTDEQWSELGRAKRTAMNYLNRFRFLDFIEMMKRRE
jgi:glycosyltransferase involved in cell wall biosynthesis